MHSVWAQSVQSQLCMICTIFKFSLKLSSGFCELKNCQGAVCLAEYPCPCSEYCLDHRPLSVPFLLRILGISQSSWLDYLTMHLDSPQYVGRLNIIKHFNLKQTNFKQTTFNLKKTILNKQPRKQTDRQTKSKQYMEGHMYSIKRFLSIPSHLSISI